MSHNNWTQMAKLAIVCLAVLALQSARIGLGKREHKSEHNQHQHDHHGANARRPMYATDLMLDAFRDDICGHANFRPWQTEQSAFGCAHKSNKSHSHSHLHGPKGDNGHGDSTAKDGQVPFEGEHAKDGEFPFLVGIRLIGNTNPGTKRAFDNYVISCSGVLVDKQYVLTTGNNCVRPASERLLIDKVSISFGQQQGQKMYRRARVWCADRLDAKSNSQRNNTLRPDGLAVIRLNKPIEYVPGKIQPACMLNEREPSVKATCALAGHCAPENAEIPSPPGSRDWKFDRTHLRTMPVKREHVADSHRPGLLNPNESSYRAQNGAGRCRADRGNPIVCYDKCSKKHPDQVQAHLAGLLSQAGQSDQPDRNPMSVIGVDTAFLKRLKHLAFVARQDFPTPGPGQHAVKHDRGYDISCWASSNQPQGVFNELEE